MLTSTNNYIHPNTTETLNGTRFYGQNQMKPKERKKSLLAANPQDGFAATVKYTAESLML